MFRRLFCCVTNISDKDKPIVYPQINETTHTCVDSEDLEMDTSSIGIFDTIPMDEALKKDKLIEWKDTIPFVPPVNKGFVIKVYDGDTITIASKLPYGDSPMYRFSVRLNGIDCPEMKGKDNDEKQCAILAKNEMIDLVLHKEIILKNVQTEKYGRILADVYINDLHINQHMVEKRLAVKYDGGTKICPKNWLNYYYKGEL
jgi:endonuclease YncB( thermonuclease family)